MSGGGRTSPSEDLGLLGLLDTNPTLRALINTWVNAYAGHVKKQDQIARWASLAMLRPNEVEACWDAIFDNGFCTRDGKTDPAAKKYLAQWALRAFPRTKPKEDA